MKTLYKLLFVAIALLCTYAQLTAQTFPAGFQATKVAEGLNPTDMEFSSDGQYLFIADKTGKVFLVENDVLLATPLMDISAAIMTDGEMGLTHLCLDPDFATNRHLYVYYTMPNRRNRVSRFTFDPVAKTLGSEYILANLYPMTGDIHTGGAMNFGKDGKLYIATGESSHPEWAQDIYNQLGKVLRMNKDGSIPTDNPFYNVLTDSLRYIYALGFRNPFAADVHPVTGRYFICDVGQNTYEEINEVIAGGNYGWATVEGPIQSGTTPPDNYQNPILYYSHDDGCAIVGAAFYAPAQPTFPVQYLDKFFYSDYCNQTIRYMDPDSYQDLGVFGSNLKRPVAFAVKPSGEFYYLDRGGLPQHGEEDLDGILWKVEYTGSLAPVIGAQPQTMITSVGGTASFSVLANGLGITYQWMRNGVDIPDTDSSTLVLSNVLLADSGTAITVRVTNSFGTATSNAAILRVTSRLPPVPVIAQPADGSTYVANSFLAFSGSATDQVDGVLAPNKLTWKIDFHHDEHYHPGLDATPGNAVTGSFFLAPNIEVSDTVWYRIYLTAENSLGLKSTVYHEVFPQKVTLHIRSLVAGRIAAIPLNLDGTITGAPVDKLSVKGVIRNIVAQTSYTINDTLFTFLGWGNGNTNPSLSITTPNTDTTITAVYDKTAIFVGEGLRGEYRKNSSVFTGTATVTRIDPVIDFSWTGEPAPGVGTQNFSVLWEGYVQPRTTGMYTFYLDNAISTAVLYLDNRKFIDRSNGGVVGGTAKDTPLIAGNKYKIRLEYWANFGATSTINLKWSGPRVFKQVIPMSSLYADAALPVRFTEFVVKPRNEALQLTWKVEDLGNVKGYAVEKRKSGAATFETIAFINTTGSNTYTFGDAAVKTNTLYEYRIRQVDLDGRAVYSSIRMGRLSAQADFDYVIVPNPADVNRQVQLIFTQAIGQAEILLISPEGKTMSRRRVTSTGQTLELPLKGIPAGTYYIKVIQGRSVLVKKLLVQ
ncbi:PQQ-dependent sugar dehydrogenase [Paraflavitalea soli]|nr:PQQ-dependent sugar dehydrogenase [Paraflavitalea soli]